MDGLGSGDADPVTLCLSKDPPPLKLLYNEHFRPALPLVTVTN